MQRETGGVRVLRRERRERSTKTIRTGPRERGIGPPQAAWRGAVERPSGGPSAPGRRCWRLGRKRPSPFSNSGPTPLRSDPNLGAMKFKVLLRKRGGARARACGRRARSCKHNDVGKLCIKYTVGSKHGTRARSILSAPCKRVARAGEGARVRVGGGARCRNAAPRGGALSRGTRLDPASELTRDHTT